MSTNPEPITWMDPEEEEADWIPPELPDPSGLPQNTDEWKCFFRWRGVPPRHPWPLAVGWAREISAPWRRGFGLSVSSKGARTQYGIWWRGAPPDYLQDPNAVNLKRTVRRARKLAKKFRHE